MVKTRSQTGNIPIKHEESKSIQTLNGISKTTKNKSKIAKRKASKNKKNLQSTCEIKVEEENDTKFLLKATSKSSKPKNKITLQDQIKQLIDYVVNHDMNVFTASSKVKLPRSTGYYYYHVYKNDPEKKIPLPRSYSKVRNRVDTPEHVKKFIRYVVDDKMSIMRASAKAGISYQKGRAYYSKCLEDPNHNIPGPFNGAQGCTQDQINRLIGYIVDEKMSIRDASIKADMCESTGGKYYRKYLEDINHGIPNVSEKCNYNSVCAQDQIKKVVNYNVDDKVTTEAALKNENMSGSKAVKHHQQHLKDRNNDVQRKNYMVSKRITQDQIKRVTNCIVDDKMSIEAASKKASVSYWTAKKYQQQYHKHSNHATPIQKISLICNPRSTTNDRKMESSGCTLSGATPMQRMLIKDEDLNALKQPSQEQQARRSKESKNKNCQNKGQQITSQTLTLSNQENSTQTNNKSKSLTQLVQHLEQHLNGTSKYQTVVNPDHGNLKQIDNKNKSLLRLVKNLEQQLQYKDNKMELLTQENKQHQQVCNTTIDTQDPELEKKEHSLNIPELALSLNDDQARIDYPTIATEDSVPKSPKNANKEFNKTRKMIKKTPGGSSAVASRLRSMKRTRSRVSTKTK